jgi:hypothetical protein
MKKLFLVLLLVCAAVYGPLLSKPGIYFNKSMDYKGFTIRTRGQLPASVEGPLNSAIERIAAAEIYTEGMKFELILPATRGQFLFFTPLMGGEYFRVNPFNGAIFLAAADFSSGEARQAPGGTQHRSLSSVITAAAAWEMTRRRVRPLTYLFMNKWKVRGYAELLSGGTGEFVPSDACAETGSPAQQDYRYGLMLDTVIKQDNTFYGDLLDKNFSRQNAELRLNKAHCGG